MLKGFHQLLGSMRTLIMRVPNLEKILMSDKLNDTSFTRDVLNRFEVYCEHAFLKKALISNTRHQVVVKKDIKTLQLLGYHLRTLLHRNDALGMASSIETRFPFLDHELVRFAVNLPYKYKIRYTYKAAMEKKHPFIAGKWILRKVADRYLPPTLSQRSKKGFPTDAFERMDINPRQFEKSFISEMLELTHDEVWCLNERATKQDRLRLMLLDVWGRINILREDLEHITQNLRNNITLQRSNTVHH
jgi:asparagine synthase (glutamine-hydrolysing)